jgi:hypothetical protein
MASHFPKRLYTAEELEKAKKFVKSGLKHQLVLRGNPDFKKQMGKALGHIKTAGFYDFLRTYIKRIVEIDGFSQLREDEAAIWTNIQLLANPIEAAGFLVQKAFLMKEFLEGKPYYGGAAEARSIEKRIEFLKALKVRTKSRVVKEECEKILKSWAESTFVF